MTFDISPRQFWRFPLSASVWEDEEDIPVATNWPSGLSIAEDDAHIYIHAAVPGVDPKDIEVTFDNGYLWIKGEAKTEDKNRKYYRRAAGTFSYRVAVPGEVDMNTEPEATAKNGVMLVTFTKSPIAQPKKISVKAE